MLYELAMKSQDNSSKTEKLGTLRPYKAWGESLGRSPTSMWRYRKRGWITTVNIAGKLYITEGAIAEFEQRATDGEFANFSKQNNGLKPNQQPQQKESL